MTSNQINKKNIILEFNFLIISDSPCMRNQSIIFVPIHTGLIGQDPYIFIFYFLTHSASPIPLPQYF